MSSVRSFDFVSAVGSRRIWIATISIILALFVALSLLAAEAPGLYMDAINPDYEVVKILHPNAPIVVWEMPGDLLFGRFPILLGLYGGSIAAYWAIPFYLMMGGSILSIRIAHLCIGVLLLIAVAVLTRQLTRSALLASAVTFVLAIDPTFIFVFRTQAYVQMIGLLFFLCSMIVMHRYPSPKGFLLAGGLLGLAGYAYFVYFLALPGFVIYVFFDRAIGDRKRCFLGFFAGFAGGVGPYVLAYGLLFGTLGLQGGLTWLHSALSGLDVSGKEQNYIDRIASTGSIINSVLSNDWQWQTFFKESHFDLGQGFKAAILIALPLLGFLLLRRRDVVSGAFALAAFPTLSFALVSTYFGSRLGGHDLAAILTLTYLCSAIAAVLLLSEFATYKKLITNAFAVLGVLVAISNVSSTTAIAKNLEKSGGRGYYSRSISLFPEHTLAIGDSTPVAFWSWGEMMPFIYETGGTIPITTSDGIGSFVCRYGRAKVVLLGSDVSSVSPASIVKGLGLKVRRVDAFGNDPTLPFETVSLEAERTVAGCADAKSQTAGVSSDRSPIISSGGSPAQSNPSATDGLRLHTDLRMSGDAFSADPPAVPVQVNGQLPQITVHWSVVGATTVEIHMASPTGILFARGGSSGSAATGNWVNSGATFFLQDVSAGIPGKTIATIVATPCRGCL